MFKRGLTGDVFGELLETGRAVKKQASQISPGKILSAASKQLTSTKKPKEEKDNTFDKMMSMEDRGKDVKEFDHVKRGFDPTKVTDEQLKKMKAVDAKKSLENYRKIQQQLLQLYLREKQKELPASQAGKAGAARTFEEEKKLIEQKRKEEEKKKKEQGGVFGGLLPKSARKTPRLGIFVKQKKGSRETKLGKAG